MEDVSAVLVGCTSADEEVDPWVASGLGACDASGFAAGLVAGLAALGLDTIETRKSFS